MLPTVDPTGRGAFVRAAGSTCPLHNSKEQPKKTFDSDQEKPISSRVENEIWNAPEIRRNAAFWYLTDNSKEAVEENDGGQTKCNVGHYNPKTWREDKCLEYARKLVQELEEKKWGEGDPSVLKFEKMRNKAVKGSTFRRDAVIKKLQLLITRYYRQSINCPVAQKKPVVGSPSSASDKISIIESDLSTFCKHFENAPHVGGLTLTYQKPPISKSILDAVRTLSTLSNVSVFRRKGVVKQLAKQDKQQEIIREVARNTKQDTLNKIFNSFGSFVRGFRKEKVD
jgi:hypothetical protein